MTIAETAAALDVDERRLRRILARAEFAGRTTQTDKPTRTGARSVTTLPPDLISDLRSLPDLKPTPTKSTPADVKRSRKSKTPEPTEQLTLAKDDSSEAQPLRAELDRMREQVELLTGANAALAETVRLLTELLREREAMAEPGPAETLTSTQPGSWRSALEGWFGRASERRRSARQGGAEQGRIRIPRVGFLRSRE